mmetsp:Transcript_144/g.170  ORF Transcript_144/g.170 Transcript_144/m.170 type:complete len:80 (-) Transcript_144:98-337(-)
MSSSARDCQNRCHREHQIHYGTGMILCLLYAAAAVIVFCWYPVATTCFFILDAGDFDDFDDFDVFGDFVSFLISNETKK